MCDTLAWVGSEGTWFAKNSDRPPSEIQLVNAFPRRSAGPDLHTQYLDLGPDPGAHAIVVATQPTWLWGLEAGVNEHRVAIGNETVYTTADRWSAPPALLGMDLVRLALERAETATHARAELCGLVERFGQGGSGWEHASEPYFSSFLIADPTTSWIVETSNRSWVARSVDHGGVAISNRLSMSCDWEIGSPDIAPGTDWQLHRDPSAPTGIADHRLAVTTSAVIGAPDFASLTAALRHHGSNDPALPHRVEPDWSGVTVCMHVRRHQATTASLVSWLPADPGLAPRHWAALGSPCVSVYVPVSSESLAFLSDRANWNRFAELRNRVEADPSGIDSLRAIREQLDPIEAGLFDGSLELDALEQALVDLVE